MSDYRRSRLLDLIELAVTWLMMRPEDPAAAPLRVRVTFHAWRVTLRLSRRLERSYWDQVGL